MPESIINRCNCQAFCEKHGRDEITTDSDGSEYCLECYADGFSGELCMPLPGACDMLFPNANEWERQFMCEKHAAEHAKWCEECLHA